MNAASQIQASPAQVAAAANPPPSTIEVADLNQFVKILTGWHTNKVKVLQHMIAIPEGSEMQLGDDGASVVLEGDMLAGFKAGIQLSLMELGTLPFGCEFEDEQQAPPANAG